MTGNKRFYLNKGFGTLNVLDMTPDNEKIYENKSSKDMGLLVDLLNELHEERQISIRLAKTNQGKKTRLKNYLKFKYGVSEDKLREIMIDDKWLSEYNDDGNLVIRND